MKIEAVDITTSFTLGNPEEAYYLAGEVNGATHDMKPMGIEIYPFVRSIPKVVKAVNLGNIREWEGYYGAETIRVHLPWMYDWTEIRHQITGDWYHGIADWAKNQVAEYAMGPAVNNHGLKIATARGIGINVHPNVTAGYASAGKLDELKAARYVLAENSVDFGSIYQPNRKVLGDPKETVKHDIEEYGLDGFLLAIDHMYGLDKVTDSSVIAQRTIQVAKVLEDPNILKHTVAMHLALPGHQFIEVGDPNMELLLKKMAESPFKHSIRPALDIDPGEFRTKDHNQQLSYLLRFRDWVLNTVERNN